MALVTHNSLASRVQHVVLGHVRTGIRTRGIGMKWKDTTKLSTIYAGLNSQDPNERATALDRMARAVAERRDLWPAGREVFRFAVANETAARPAASAAAGLEQIDGVEAARPAWYKLLTHPDPRYACEAASRIGHPAYAGLVRQLLETRDDHALRVALVRAAGSMRDREAVPLLIRLGEDRSLQVSIVYALGDIGDPAAIPWVEQFVNDDRELPDERGARQTFGEIASGMLRRLRREPGYVRPEMAVTRPGGQPEPPGFAPPPVPAFAARAMLPRRAHPAAWVGRLGPFVTLTAAGLEVVLLIFLFLLLIFVSGDQRPPSIPTRLADAIAMLPALAGLFSGAWVMGAGRAPLAWHKVLLLLGALLCALFVLWFGRDMLRS